MWELRMLHVKATHCCSSNVDDPSGPSQVGPAKWAERSAEVKCHAIRTICFPPSAKSQKVFRF